MMQRVKINLAGIAVLSLIAFSCGCTLQTQKNIPPQQEIRTALLPPPQTLEMKVDHLDRILRSGTLDDQQIQAVSKLKSIYEEIQQRAVDHQGQLECPDTATLLFKALDDLEDMILTNTQTREDLQKEVVHQYAEMRKEIFDKYLYGDYQGVIDRAIGLEAAFGSDALTSEIRLVFALSLAKKGMLEEALNAAERTLPEIEARPDLVHLRANMVEWQLALGNRAQARQVYEKLVDNLDERKAVFARTQKNLSAKREETVTEHRPLDIEGDASMPGGEGPKTIEHLIEEVERLIGNYEFQKAKLLIIKRKIRVQDESETILLEKTFQRVEQAEAEFQRQVHNAPPVEQDALSVARALVEDEKLEEAIEYIKTIEKTENIPADMMTLKTLATERLINREREKAARLFLMSKNSTDTEKKKEYLVSSHKLLTKLIEQYPLSPSSQKVISNIKTVEKELMRLGIDPG